MGKNDDYDDELEKLQLALVRWQQAAMASGEKTLIIFEGRDAAGKDGAIKRVVEHLSVRNTRVIALPKPSDRDRSLWFFQRYVAHLPAAGETVIFNRSWYNRAGVERVMDFSSNEEQEDFLRDVPGFEAMLAESGLRLIKLWLDISKDEQAERLAERAKDPLKALKRSALDAEAQPRWEAYSMARDEMLRRSHSEVAPWVCVSTDNKKTARLNILRHLVATLDGPGSGKAKAPDKGVVFPFEIAAVTDGRLNP